MKKPPAYQELEFPLFRKLVIDAAELAKKKSTIYGLVEFDITETIQKIRQYRIKTKSPLSLTAYILFCLGKAVENNKQVHGYLYKNKLKCFDDVDCCLPIEIKIKDQFFPFIHILRAINRRSFQDIEREIRQAKEAGIQVIELNIRITGCPLSRDSRVGWLLFSSLMFLFRIFLDTYD